MKKRLVTVIASILLGTIALALSILILSQNPNPVVASSNIVYTAELGVFKKPGISTVFVVTNTTATTATIEHQYYHLDDPLTPVHTQTHALAINESETYTVGEISQIPATFYGRLLLISNQTFEVDVIAPHKLIRGKVHYDRTPTPVTNARVVAHRVGAPDRIEAKTDSNGAYAIPVDSGRWLLEVLPAHGITQTDWIYVDPPQEVEFTEPPSQREVKTVNLSVQTATGHLLGRTLPYTVPVKIIARNSKGIGNVTKTNPEGFFDLQVPVGAYNVYVQPISQTWGGPSYFGVHITETTKAGIIHLQPATMAITGQVHHVDGRDLNEIPGVSGPATVIAWERRGRGWGATQTDAQGYYTLPLVVKPALTEWVVRVVPPATNTTDDPLVPPKPREIILHAGHNRELNMPLLSADGRITGYVVDPSDTPLEILGRAHALRQPPIDAWPRHFSAPMYNGEFTIAVPTTHTHEYIYDVGIRPDPTSGYAPGYQRNVNPPTSGSTNISITLSPRDAIIAGALVDARDWPNTTIITDVAARVFAIDRPLSEEEGDWQSRWIDPRTGTYKMGVVSGTWRVDFRVATPQRDRWIPDPRFKQNPQLFTVSSGEMITVPLPVVPLNRSIAGIVQIQVPDPANTGFIDHPLPYVKVCARGIDPENQGINLCTETGQFGGYILHTTPGHYIVQVLIPQSLRDRGYLEPDKQIVNPSEGNVNFVVRKANATVQGTVSISATETLTQSKVLIWGWSLKGSHVYSEVILNTDPGGTFVIDPSATYAISTTGTPRGEVWYFGAAYQSGGILYRAPRQRIVVHKGEVVTLDMQLESLEDLLGRLPEGRSFTFDRSLGIVVGLGDGVTLRIPAGAIPADTQEVTIDLYPLGMMPEQRFEEVIGYGYALAAYDGNGVPITARFYEEVALTMPYDEANLPPGTTEMDILPAYLSTTTGRWEPPESYFVDADEDKVTLYIDHFTDFALTGSPQLEPSVYLPMIMRSYNN